MRFIRYLLAVAFVVFCVTGLMTWALNPIGVPWWLPFAAAVVLPAIIGGAILIVSGRQAFE